MKRVFKQKNKAVLSRSVNPSEALAQLPENQLSVTTAASSEGPRRTRTSAAMLGLAISVSATGMLLPGRSGKAVAAEPMAAEQAFEPPLSAKLVKNKNSAQSATKLESNFTPKVAPATKPQAKLTTTARKSQPASFHPAQPKVTTQINQGQPKQSLPKFAATPKELVKHQVKKGDTLWQLSQKYAVNPEQIAISSQIEAESVLSIGQTLRIPSQHQSNAPSPTSSAPLVSQAAPSNLQQPSTNTSVLEESGGAINVVGKVDKHFKNKQDVAQEGISTNQESANRTLAQLSSQYSNNGVGEQAQLSPIKPASEFKHSDRVTIDVPSPDDTKVTADGSAAAVALPIPITAPEATAKFTQEPPQAVTLTIAGAQQSSVSSVASPEQSPETTASQEPVLELVVPPGEQENLAVQPVSQPTPIVVVNQPQVYEVKPGDTLDQIAKVHGSSLSELIQFNRIENPNFINISQHLSIPTDQEQSSEAKIAQVPLSPAVDAGELPLVNGAQENTTVASEAVATEPSEKATSRAGVEVEAPNNLTQQSRDPNYDPYIAKLKADVERMRAEIRQQRGVETETTAVNVPVVPSLSNAVSSSAENLNPEWTAAENQAEVSIEIKVDPPATQLEENSSVAVGLGGTQRFIRPPERRQNSSADPQLEQQPFIATAPVPVESYNQLINTPVGEMVSPELPPLPSPDQYLPGGSDRFSGYIWPAKGVLTSGFGWRWGRMHKGIDVAAPVGTPIMAAAPGEVVSAGWNSGGYGNLVKIKHPDGSLTLYAHNSRINVRRGQQVTQGQKIAEMGSTGYSTGPHLHFEVHPSGRGAVNPIAHLPAR